MRSVGFLLFDGVERFDFEGPLAVLAWASKESGAALEFRLMSKDGKPVHDHLLERPIPIDGATADFKRFDLLIVPGGDLAAFGGDGDLVKEVGRMGAESAVVASVCTGAFIVAKTGLADGKSMTTHHAFKQRFRTEFPRVTVPAKARFVRDGTLWSSAGISAGVDLSLQLVSAVWGEGVAKKVQHDYLEYCPEPPFPC